MAQRTPIRLAICVDGTLCDPDGSVLSDREHKNVTNVYRLCASIQKGLCTDSNGKTYRQEKKYFYGIASKSNRSHASRLVQGVFGKDCLKQVQEVYRECCRLDGPEDEVWLYGFSRGAWVVRAVAGLLHHIRALSATTTDQVFEKEYAEALEVYRKMQKQGRTGQGQIHQMLASRTHGAPTIKFVGVFDTVKALDDDGLFDISFNDSINHLRHALALNEDRVAMQPEYLYPTFSHSMTLLNRTFIQSWFIGAHIDTGGSSKNDGLSLYPLQWMLLESRDVGLCLGFDGSFGGRIRIDNPLELTGLCDNDSFQVHTTTTQNGLVLKMIDIRSVHNRHGYAAQINRTKPSVIWKRNHRRPFTPEGRLEGYGPFASRGTIIHPSVYLVLDMNKSIYLDVLSSPLCGHLETWRLNSLGWDDKSLEIPNLGFWNKVKNSNERQEPGAIRILVCGNTGVGKSTLINGIFGVEDGEEATGTSHFKRGVHNVKEEITWPNRPDIIVHDSGGFETAKVEELEAIEDFLREKSTAVEVDGRLHTIWFCLDTNDCRPGQEGTEKLFRAIELYAQDVPVLLIATKKDRFLADKAQERRRWLSSQNEPYDFDSLDRYAEHELQKHVDKIQEEILGLQGARFDACVAVSKFYPETIEELSRINTECFSNERIRLLYIRAQVARIDLKVDMAVCETMRIYKDVLASTVSMAAVPFGSATNRFASAIEVFRVIINCFGMPTVSPELAYEIFKSQLFQDLGSDFAVLFAECMSTLCTLMSGLTLGVPFFLIPMATNIPLVVPAAERLILMLACDLILVFSRCFREASDKCTQPKLVDLKMSVALYRKYYKEVHLRIATTFPKRNVFNFFRVGEVQESFKKVIEDFKKQVMGEPTLKKPQYRSSWDDASSRPLAIAPSRPSMSTTIGADADLGSNAEGPDQARISEQDDREVIEKARKSLAEDRHKLQGPV